MKKQSWITLMVLALGVVFLVAGVYATQQAADCMTLNSKVYPKHTKALVMFSHKKHNVDYKIACTDCHHVIKDGKNVWKEGDEVQKCDACHGEAKPPTGKDAPKLSKAEKIKKYHYSAIHENCAGCHKANKKKGMERPGPTSCKECHPKKE
jgi:cytochrome c553